ncbi:acyltransferase [Psychrosphaera ytuae]|uniref:Acyltransferase n=1 Tax=Psychrosphaera ytuae TaxID=2820710 RepID=A0A975HJE2_9GAMM|nr:acyltransferase [Psychrosphaera ytuae]QTH63119.1 acyltransferase [Psychrosphaera ytuae]
MNKSLSLYLDIFRFMAATVVFLSHIASQKISGGMFWQFKDYSQTAVMIFFVMSGFVIAFVTEQKEKTLKEYSIARVSRLYSIILPALAITFIFDFIGYHYNPSFYEGGPWPYDSDNLIRNYFLTAFLVQNVWDFGFNPGINQPFWSLTYEWFYYLIFACSFYLKSNYKYLVILLLAAIAGPTIIALMPIWVLGFLLFKSMNRNKNTGPIYSILSIASLVAIVWVGPMVRDVQFVIPWIERTSIIGDYFDAVLFCIHIYFSPALLKFFDSFLEKYAQAIRFLGALTFSLYLFHRPVIQTIAALYSDHNNLIYKLSLIIAPLIIVLTIGMWSEKQKYYIRTKLSHIFGK